ncbi:MAG: hypothetical protein AAF215_01575 [Cyanobacteria bacterium P01_A01_bin.123]
MKDSTPVPDKDAIPVSQAPKIVNLNMLDTDYAKLLNGELIPEERKYRLKAEAHTYERLSKQIARYRHGKLEQTGRDDILCNIGATVDLFSPADMDVFNDRLRISGQFYLTAGERQQVINWLQDELLIDLDSSA